MGLFLEGEWGRWAAWWVFSELLLSVESFLFPAGPQSFLFVVGSFNYMEQHLLANYILITSFPLAK